MVGIPVIVIVVVIAACLVWAVFVLAERADRDMEDTLNGENHRPTIVPTCQECGYTHQPDELHSCWRCGGDIAGEPDRIQEHPVLPNQMWCAECPPDLGE